MDINIESIQNFLIMCYRTCIIVLFLIKSALAQNLLNGPEDIIFDNPSNRVLVSNWVSGTIVQIDSANIQSYFKTGLSHAHGMELLGDTLFVASDYRIVGLRLTDSQTIWQINIPGASRLGHITIDDSLNLYASDWFTHKIFKINIPSQTYTTMVGSGINTPVGIMIDSEYNRLILCQFINNIPLHSIDLSSYQVTPMSTANFNQLDAIVRDKDGNFYISVWSTGNIISYNRTFSNVPSLISSGHNGPSGLGYNAETYVLGVTNYNSNSISLIQLPATVLKNDGENLSSGFLLDQNYPNPFNSTTTIEFHLPGAREVTLKVYTLLGEELTTLLSASLVSGSHTVEWDASNLTSGVYLYRLHAGDYVETRRMVLMK